MKEIEELMKKRFKVIADFPGNDAFDIGDVIEVGTTLSDYRNYPHIFKPMSWYEERTMTEMLAINYIKVVEYVGYWVVDDIVPIDDYNIDTKNKKFLGFIIGTDKRYTPNKCEPATKEQYDAWKVKEKRS